MHAPRIAAKRLHYLVEPLVTGKEAATVLKPLKMRQDRLEVLHDRRVLAQNLDQALKSSAPVLLRTLRDFARKLAARSVHSASRA